MLSNLVKIAAVVLALTFVPALSGISSAAAQESDGKSTARKVEELAGKGAQAYGQERYREAIKYFEQAYALQPVPNLLYNIGRCHEKLDEYEKAIEHYEEFAVAPEVGSEARREALERAESLREIADIAKSDDSPSMGGQQGNQSAQTTMSVDEEPSSPLPWIVTGAGVGVLAAGGAFGLMASSSADEIQNGEDFQTRKDAQSRAKTQALVADSLFVVGAVTTGVGIYLLLSSGNEKSEKANALVLPYAHDSGAGVGVRLDF